VDIAVADSDKISIFLTQNIGDIDIDILYCSAMAYSRILTSMLFLDFQFVLTENDVG